MSTLAELRSATKAAGEDLANATKGLAAAVKASRRSRSVHGDKGPGKGIPETPRGPWGPLPRDSPRSSTGAAPFSAPPQDGEWVTFSKAEAVAAVAHAYPRTCIYARLAHASNDRWRSQPLDVQHSQG